MADDTYQSLYFDYQHHAFSPPPEMRGETPLHPVAIAGGGPVGLALALGLARRGIPFVLLEDEDTVNRGSRAVGTARRSVEIFDRLGVGERFMAKGTSWSGGRSWYRGKQVLEFKVQHDPRVKHPPMISIAQCHVEQYLLDGLAGLPGADIRWQSRVTGAVQKDGHVVLGVSTPEGEYELRAAWVAGCDGARSAVRKALGLELGGSSYEGRYLIADVKLDSAEPPGRRVWFDPAWHPGSTIIMHKQPDDIWRIDYQLRPEDDLDEELKPERVRARVGDLLQAIGERGQWQIDWVSPYRAHSLTLESYRHGRVLFAGDAAHLVPIFGARGMNSGIDDANNLAWKLAFVVRGWANAALLDSYSEERVAATRVNMAQAEKSTQFMTPPTRGHAIMREAVLSLAVSQGFIRPLIDPRQVTEVVLPGSPLNLPGRPEDRFAGGLAPGWLCPNLPVTLVDRAQRSRAHLQELLGADFTLLVFCAKALSGREPGAALQSGLPFGLALVEILAAGAEPPARRHVQDASGELFAAFDAADGTACLVRPDGHIAGRWKEWNAAQVRRDVAKVAHFARKIEHVREI